MHQTKWSRGFEAAPRSSQAHELRPRWLQHPTTLSPDVHELPALPTQIRTFGRNGCTARVLQLNLVAPDAAASDSGAEQAAQADAGRSGEGTSGSTSGTQLGMLRVKPVRAVVVLVALGGGWAGSAHGHSHVHAWAHMGAAGCLHTHISDKTPENFLRYSLSNESCLPATHPLGSDT